jgi:hypothetical protein
MIPKTVLAAVLTLSLCSALRAQPIETPEPGKIGLTFLGKFTSSGKGDLRDNTATFEDVSTRNYSWLLSQHIALGQGRRLSIAVDYDQTDIDTPTDSQIPLPNRFESLSASLRYFHPFSRQWMLSTSVGAGSSVTDTGLLSDGWGARASAIAIYNRNRQLTFMFGIAYNSLAEDLKVVPVFGLDWRPAEKWSVAIGFPKTGVTYKMNKEIALSLAISGAGGAFYVKDDPKPGVAPRSLADSKLQYLEARIGFSCDWKINDTFRVSGTVGQVLLRQFKYIDHDYKLKSHGTVPFLSLAGTISL